MLRCVVLTAVIAVTATFISGHALAQAKKGKVNCSVGACDHAYRECTPPWSIDQRRRDYCESAKRECLANRKC